jgi:hypothetical protein
MNGLLAEWAARIVPQWADGVAVLALVGQRFVGLMDQGTHFLRYELTFTARSYHDPPSERLGDTP